MHVSSLLYRGTYFSAGITQLIAFPSAPFPTCYVSHAQFLPSLFPTPTPPTGTFYCSLAQSKSSHRQAKMSPALHPSQMRLQTSVFAGSQEVCCSPVPTENVKTSILPAASGGNISRSETTQIPLFLAVQQMKTRPTFLSSILSGMFAVHSGLFRVATVWECMPTCAVKLCFLFQLVRGLQRHSPMFEC